MPGVIFTKTVAAPPEVVFDVLTDHRGYAKITPLRAVDMERDGEPEPNGVGAIRVMYPLGRRFPGAREQVLEYKAPTRFVYQILSGLPARHVQGDVELEAVPEGTRLEYRHEVIPAFPVPAAVVRAGIRVVIGTLIRGITKESERRVAAA